MENQASSMLTEQVRGVCIFAVNIILKKMKTGRTTIVFTEIPYQVNKARVIERIAELVKEKKLEGISELRDESDKEGMRIAIDLKRGENAEVIVNNLF